jgi:protease IV
MTNRQKITIVCILALPIIIGMLLVIGRANSSSLSPKVFKKIGLVQINDIILVSEPYVKQLRALREDNAIAGVLLRIDSPGGAVAPAQEIFSEAMKFRGNKPLVASFGNVAASGGYYIASPALKIFANPGTITASIGVIFRFPQYFKLMDKLGISMQVLKSGGVKDMGSPQREMTPQEKKLFQDMLDNIHDQFIKDVSRARGMNIDSLRPIADGRIMTGQQALGAHLVDTLGSFEDAADYLKNYLGLSPSTGVIEKKQHESFWKSLVFGELAEKFPFLKSSFCPAGSYFLYDRQF